jgi:hypothetical protein
MVYLNFENNVKKVSFLNKVKKQKQLRNINKRITRRKVVYDIKNKLGIHPLLIKLSHLSEGSHCMKHVTKVLKVKKPSFDGFFTS